MLRNFLLCLSLLVVVCYANRVVMRTTAANDAVDIYTSWRYGDKDAEGEWKDSAPFLVELKDVPNPELFIRQFNDKGKAIAVEYGFDNLEHAIGFESASTNPNPSANDAKVIATIDLNTTPMVTKNKENYYIRLDEKIVKVWMDLSKKHLRGVSS
eukprot:Platyproteum_vivax@DN7443_c0_g2_i3.p1